MKRHAIILFLLINIVPYTSTYAQKSKQAKTEDILTLKISQLAKGKFNGFGLAIVDEKGVRYQKGFGFANVATKQKYTINTIQNIASISKTVVGLALMKAQELGKLKLDDPINKYLPFKVVNPNFPDVSITIKQLANHTSSIVDNEFYLSKNYYLKPNQDLKGKKLVFDETQVFNQASKVQSMPTFLKDLLTLQGKWYKKDGFSNHKPGEIYEYSNTATTLTAYIIEEATGMSFSAFTKQYILKPLQMNASGWKFGEVDFKNYSHLYENPKESLPFYAMVTYPDGNFITSTKDLSNYLIELIKGYNGHGTILSKASYAEFFRPQLSAKNFIERNERNPNSESYNVGIFMGFGYTGYIGHTGGDPGVVSILFFDPKTSIGRLMFFNTSIADNAGMQAFYGIWDLLEKYSKQL